MSRSEELRGPAPEIFVDEMLRPSDLAAYFAQYAEEMVAAGWAERERNTVVSRYEIGLNFVFNSDRAVRSVHCSTPRTPKGEQTVYQISFKPPSSEIEGILIDGSSAKFEVVTSDVPGGSEVIRTFERKHLLKEGDQEVNEFFRDMADIIDPENLREELTSEGAVG